MKTTLLFVKKGLFVLLVSFAFTSNAQKATQQEIDITNFQVIKDHNKISIKWATDSVSQTNYFEVEKSNDGKNFKTVAYVLGADPTQKDGDSFGCFDSITGKFKTFYYRLKHVNLNGNVQFSEVKMLALK